MAGIMERAIGEPFQLIATNAHIRKPARQAELLAELGDDVSRTSRAAVSSEDPRDATEPLLSGALVELHDGGEAQRVREPVMQTALARERMRERMARAEPFLKSDGP